MEDNHCEFFDALFYILFLTVFIRYSNFDGKLNGKSNGCVGTFYMYKSEREKCCVL